MTLKFNRKSILKLKLLPEQEKQPEKIRLLFLFIIVFSTNFTSSGFSLISFTNAATIYYLLNRISWNAILSKNLIP